MNIELTNEEVDLLLKQIYSLEKALDKVKKCKRIMKATSLTDMYNSESLIIGLKQKLLTAKER